MDDPSAIAQAAVARSYRTRVVALPSPFAGAPDEAWLHAAYAEEIVNGLSRLGRVAVVSARSAARSTTRELAGFGPDFLVECRLEKVGDRFLSRVELSRSDGADPHTLVEEAPAEGLQDLRDRIVQRLIERIGFRRGGTTPGPEVSPHIAPASYLALQHALQMLWRLDREGSDRATRIVDEALAAEPDCAQLLALRGFLAARAYRSGWLGDRDAAVRTATKGCEAAARASVTDTLLLWTTAFCEAMLFRRYPQAADLVTLAHHADPCASHVLTWGSLFLSYDQEFEMALTFAYRSLACSPRDPMAVTQHFAGALAAVHSGRHDEAVAFCDGVLALNPAMQNVLRIRAAACMRLGREDEARTAIAKLITLDPAETVALVEKVNPLREWAGFARFTEALAAAGLPRR